MRSLSSTRLHSNSTANSQLRKVTACSWKWLGQFTSFGRARHNQWEKCEWHTIVPYYVWCMRLIWYGEKYCTMATIALLLTQPIYYCIDGRSTMEACNRYICASAPRARQHQQIVRELVTSKPHWMEKNNRYTLNSMACMAISEWNQTTKIYSRQEKVTPLAFGGKTLIILKKCMVRIW